ncbi:baseplate J/gp47 family protein [Lachnospiraceae bacterium 46-15]
MSALNYSVVEPIEGEAGAYKIQCETAGTEGNQQLGALLPIEYVEGLETASLTEILIPGEDDEDVETFRERYFASFSSGAFGGNKADYINKVNGMDGVGACKVIRMWEQGYAPSDMIPCGEVTTWVENQSETTIGTEVHKWLKCVHDAAGQKLLTTGGTIKIIIITSEFKEPSAMLIDTVQQTLDPHGASGEGEGIVPIGHIVNVMGVKDKIVDFTFTITYETDYTFESLREPIEGAIDSYFLRLRQKWADSDSLVVRVSQIESLLLGLEGIIDIEDTMINGVAGNLVLDIDQIPVRGDINE